MKRLFVALLLIRLDAHSLAAEKCGEAPSLTDAKERNLAPSLMPIFDTSIATWADGFPSELTAEVTAKLKPQADAFAWTKVDLDAKNGPELLLASSLLQGKRGRYWNYIVLRIFCQESSVYRECAQLQLSSPPAFLHSPTQTQAPVKDYGFDYLAPPIRIGVFPHDGKGIIGVFEDKTKLAATKRNADFYRWEPSLTEISPHCQRREDKF